MQGKLTGYAWHIQKRRGTSKKRKICFNCINYSKEDNSCNKYFIPITNNNAKYCSNFINENNEVKELEEYRYVPKGSYMSKEELEKCSKITENKWKLKELKKRTALTLEDKRAIRKKKRLKKRRKRNRLNSNN